MPIIKTREEWLHKVAELLAPEFEKHGYKKVPAIRVGVGFTSKGARSKRIGECHAASRSKDKTHEIFIHPSLHEDIDVAETLTHEIAHAVVGLEHKHGSVFKRCATSIGLEGKMTATVAGPQFKEMIAPILKKVGKYPTAPFSVALGKSSTGPKQTTRLVKVTCGSCGYNMRITRKWIGAGVPKCPNAGCASHERVMDVPE